MGKNAPDVVAPIPIAKTGFGIVTIAKKKDFNKIWRN